MNQQIRDYLTALQNRDNRNYFQGATNAEIDAAEQTIGLQFPAELREWLREVNGAGLFLGISGKYNLVVALTRVYPDWIQRGWLPVATDGCGNDYVLITMGEYGNSRPVGFVDACSDPDEICYIVGSSLERFIEFLAENEYVTSFCSDRLMSSNYESWPFSKNFVTSKDPEIMTLDNAPLPWTKE